MPTGKQHIPIRYIINAPKGLTGYYVLWLMYYYNNWYILGYIWSILFARNIIKKEESLKKKMVGMCINRILVAYFLK